ncbi:T9SS type A sorting domain-containing protein [uncultured Winogradskyella sp.]|uniref:T9SS type A sorting domain-containing protein n=1 Tax=uncultured Winogradskyella sp. TaxID=395353 RepID=UPI00262DCBE5|nr:T9SS type A sorting domain-containing protein [uncultured Winogradskyella sp.]
MRTISTLLCAILFVTFSNSVEAQSEIQRVRIDFENPEGFTRHLLLGFVPDNSATDGFDYGYDALNPDDLPDDLNWIIEGDRYVIQGVGEFSVAKYYPLGMFLTNSGDISISLRELENFETEVNVYLYDLEYDSYTLLNETDMTQNISAGNYLDRFFVAFSNDIHLEVNSDYNVEIDKEYQKDVNIWYSKDNDELHINGLSSDENSILNIYSLEGKKIWEDNCSEKDYIVNTSEILNGIYFLTIETSTFLHSTKVCITN